MSKQYRQLVLCPIGEKDTVTLSQLTMVLSGLGLIADRISEQWPHRYYIGERFLQYLSFMGCAPALEFKPVDLHNPDWSTFTFVSFTSPLQTTRCYIDTLMAKPRCPRCGKRHALASGTVNAMLTCPKCGQAASPAEWDFLEFGGCARQFISIVNVYPKESLPTDTLLQHLHDKTQLHWHYFYLHHELLDAQN